MAEKIVLFEGDINLEKAIKDTKALKEEVNRLKDETVKLKYTQGETSEAYIKANAQLKAAQSELRTQESMITKVTVAQRQNVGSIEQLRSQLAAVSIAWAKEAKAQGENSERAKRLAKQKLELTEALKKEEKATGDSRRGVGEYERAMSGLPGPIGRATSSIGTMSKALVVLLANPVVLTITAIVGALAVLYKSFKSTDEGATELAARMEQLNTVMDRGRQYVNDLRKEWVELRKELVEIQKLPLFTQLLIAMGIKKNLEVPLKEAAKAAYEYKQNIDVLDDAETQYMTKKSSNLRDIARLETMAQDRTLSTKQRIQALEQAVSISEQELEKTKEFAERRFNLEVFYAAKKYGLKEQEIKDFVNMDDEQAKREMETNKRLARFRNYYNDERYKNLVELNTRMIDADTQFFQAQKRNVSRLSAERERFAKEDETRLKEDLDKKRKAAEEAIKYMQNELEMWKLTNKQKVESLDADYLLKEQELIDKRYQEKLITKQEYDLLNLQLETEFQDKLNEIKQKADEKEKERLQLKLEAAEIDYENDLAIAEDNIFKLIEVERIGLEMRRQQEIEYAEKIGADVSKINGKYRKAEIALNKAVIDAKLSMTKDFADNLAQAFGENTAVGKAAAVASTTIDTYKSATASYAALAGIPVVGPVLGFAAAAAAVAAGLANVKKILSVKTGLPGEKSVAASSPSASIAQISITQSLRSTVNPEIGQGIVSRETGFIESSKRISLQPTLVIDDVTLRQNLKLSQIKTSTL